MNKIIFLLDFLQPAIILEVKQILIDLWDSELLVVYGAWNSRRQHFHLLDNEGKNVIINAIFKRRAYEKAHDDYVAYDEVYYDMIEKEIKKKKLL